jgi:hypothetical protein
MDNPDIFAVCPQVNHLNSSSFSFFIYEIRNENFTYLIGVFQGRRHAASITYQALCWGYQDEVKVSRKYSVCSGEGRGWLVGCDL